jgi:hypothetical protein
MICKSIANGKEVYADFACNATKLRAKEAALVSTS